MLTADRCREILDYDPETGTLRNKVKRGGLPVGAVCGSVNSRGYFTLSVDGKIYQAHRLAWLHFYGEWPDGPIDHVDQCKLNNVISNLRVVTDVENARNQSKPQTNNLSGHRGVCFNRRVGKFQAQLFGRGRSAHVGYFTTPEEASEAYERARDEW